MNIPSFPSLPSFDCLQTHLIPRFTMSLWLAIDLLLVSWSSQFVVSVRTLRAGITGDVSTFHVVERLCTANLLLVAIVFGSERRLLPIIGLLAPSSRLFPDCMHFHRACVFSPLVVFVVYVHKFVESSIYILTPWTISFTSSKSRTR